MPKDIIVKYYLLCSANKVSTHFINELPARDWESIFSKKTLEMFFRESDNTLIANEYVIGGEDIGDAFIELL